jgi:SAM-dependent methyltransferase
MTSSKLHQLILAILDNKQTALISSLHSKLIEVLKAQATIITSDKLALDDIKVTRLLILIEGLIKYLVQFGLDKNLLQKAIRLRSECWIEQGLPSLFFEDTYHPEIEKTLLFFAWADGLVTNELLKQAAINFAKVLPWNVNDTYKPSLESKETAIVAKSVQRAELMEMPQADEKGRFIPSIFSQGGFILSKLDKYTEEFVKHAVICGGTVLNIGSGYGIPERLALLLGAKKIICNDICAEHLEIIKNLTPKIYHPNLDLAVGSFPDEITLSANSVRVIGIFRVLHFFDPDLLVGAIKKAHELLETGGTLIISAETPYLGNWKKFIPIYERRKEQKESWPGYIPDTSDYETAGYSRRLPPKMHFLDVAVLTRVLTENGFSIIRCTTLNRADTFPEHLLYNGQESVGAVAQKVIHSRL